jgi:dynein intermediate chain 1
LTEEQLNEDMPQKMLTANNPSAPKNSTIYDYNTRKFKTDELIDQLVIHFALEGDIILKESLEDKIQEEIADLRSDLIQRA